MERVSPRSHRAASATSLVEDLQRRLVAELERVSAEAGQPSELSRLEWLRDEGRHGGGVRYAVSLTPTFNQASVNVSQVHYDDEPAKRLSSATALSTIIHPANPRAPSMHMHISWTEMRDGSAYWRMMADLNPAIEDPEATAAFEETLRSAAPEQFEEAKAQGERYFFIPALGRHRGVAHFYLEGFSTGDLEADAALARRLGETTIDRYAQLLREAWRAHPSPSEEDRAAQLAYHTVYLFQVLTLDRGTTSGLLVHAQNDLGIMGSLPNFVDRDLLASWEEKMTPPQDELLLGLVAALPPESPAPVTAEVRRALARTVREHYRAHPEALQMQASGNVIPPTVQNHAGS